MNSISVQNINTTLDMSKLVEEYGDSLLRMCFIYLKDMHLAEDAVQDTFIKVYKGYCEFKGHSAEKTWIMRIAINVCKNYLRSSWWKRINETINLDNIPSNEKDSPLQDDELLLEIMKLSSKYKEVILLFYYQDMKIREIAAMSDNQSYNLFDTGIDLATVISTSTTKTIPLNMNYISGGGGNLFDKLQEKGTINILKTDEMNIPLPNINFVHISNIGIIDGRLHVQTKWTSGGIDDHGFFNLINTSGDKIDPSNVYFDVDKNGHTKYGRKYVEYIFEVKETELNKYKLNGDSFTTHGHYTQGKWQTTFKLEAVEKSNEINCNIDLGETKINKVSISPIGISLVGTGNKEDNTDNIKVGIKMLDGSTVTLNSVISQNEDGEVTHKYMALAPIDIAKIKEISINDNILKLK